MSRFDFIKYDDSSFYTSAICKDIFLKVETIINTFPESREKDLVMTRLEEAFMWVGKCIRNEQIKRNES